MTRDPYKRGYKLRSAKTTKGTDMFAITVPPAIAAVVPEGAVFDPEITEDGILYRFRRPEPEPVKPDWIKD